MKRFILFMFFSIFSISPVFSGDPILLKGTKLTFGDTSNTRPFGVLENNSYIYIYGYSGKNKKNGEPIRLYGFLACFDSLFALKWVFRDSSSDRPYIARAIPLSNGGIVAELLDGWKSETTLLFINETGTLMKRIMFNGIVSLEKSGEKIIGVTAETNGVVYTMDENGAILNQWNSPYYNGGKVAIQVLGNSMWLSSFSYEGTYVAKHNAETGELFWRRIIPNGFLGYSDIDSAGNSYFASTQLVPNPDAPGFTTASQWHFEKLDSEGNIVWETEWFSRETWVGRVNAAITTIRTNSAKNLVVIGGDIQKEETIADGSRANYLAGFSMDSGEMAWEKKWSYSDAYVSTVYGVCFDTEGNMFVAGYEYNGPPPAYAHIEKYSVESIPTDINDDPIAQPISFSLSQNYPNPFNSTTTIHYSIPICGTSDIPHVQLKVYDLLGREVAILVNEEKPVGEYSVQFNASSLASGIYFYQLTVGGQFIETKKMVLLR